MKLLEIEVDGPHNECLSFPPMGRNIRGRFDVTRAVKHDKDAAKLFNIWPDPVPGQRLGIDTASGEAYLDEPLHEPEHTVTRERILTQHSLEPARQTFANVHAPTWLFWIKRAVESGVARVVKGTLPAVIDGEPKTSFITTPVKDTATRLAEALEAQNKMLADLLKRKG